MAEPIEAKVAVVRAENRRGAVAEALSLIADLRFGTAGSNALIIPQLSADLRPGRSTHQDTISAVVDVLLAAGAQGITLAASPPQAEEPSKFWYERLGYAAELWGRPVSFLNLGSTAPLNEQRGGIRTQVPDRLSQCAFRVSLAVAHRAGLRGTRLGFAGLLNLLDPNDRARLESVARADGLLDRLLGRASDPQRSTESLARINELIAVAQAVRPTLSIIDTFSAVRRSGPSAPRRTRGFVVAGTDPVAVDVVAATILGADPQRIGYLAAAQSAGLGIADLSRIEIVGDYSLVGLKGNKGIPRMHVRSSPTRAAQTSSQSR